MQMCLSAFQNVIKLHLDWSRLLFRLPSSFLANEPDNFRKIQSSKNSYVKDPAMTGVHVRFLAKLN